MHNQINKQLQALSDVKYKAFNSRIVSTGYPMLGVRVPSLRALAKTLAKDPTITSYLEDPHITTYEGVLLYGMILSNIKKLPVDDTLHYLDSLIPCFDNWAHVDCVTSCFKGFKNNLDGILVHYLPLKIDGGEFTKRFFVILLLSYYINDEYIDRVLTHLTQVPQGQYYVDMAIAWMLSVTLVKYYDKTLTLLEQHAFSKFVHNKAIQKARESYRISPETKDFLNGLKIK